MDKQQMNRVVTVANLWEVFADHFLAILLGAILCMAALFVYSNVILEPEYQSTATIYVLRHDNEPDYVYTQSDFTLAKDVVKDCTYVFKSEDVLEEVIQSLQLDMSYSTLAKKIKTNNPESTRFLEVSVSSDSPESAKTIVNRICDVGSEKISQSMGFDQVNLYAYGKLPVQQSNAMGLLHYAVAFMIGVIVLYLIYLVKFILDTNIRTEEDVVKYLGISVLADIPNCTTGRTRKKGKYRYRYYKQYGRRYAYDSGAETSKRGRHNKK